MNPARNLLGLSFVVVLLALSPSAASAATCSDYSNQAAAQAAKDTRDADGDGRYCETLPCPCASGGGSSSSNGDAARARRAAAAKRQAAARRRAAQRRAAAERRRRAALRAKRAAERKERLARQRVERGVWRVSQVVDGDTVRVRRTDGSGAETIRLIGLDTPETKKPGVAVECGGLAATATMLALGFQGAIDTDGDGLFDAPSGRGVLVALKTDRSQDVRDRFGRLLAFIDARDDLPPFAAGKSYDFGKIQVQAGNSTAYRYQGSRFTRYGRYSKAQKEARTASRGAWGACGGNFHSEQ